MCGGANLELGLYCMYLHIMLETGRCDAWIWTGLYVRFVFY